MRSGILVRRYFYHIAPDSHCAIVDIQSKKTSTIQYGYRKCGTHAVVFS